MEVIRDPRLTSGFVYENPLPLLGAVTHCGEAVTIAGHALESHQHQGFEFILSCRGSYTWSVGRQRYRQEAGDMFITFPCQTHQTAPVSHPASHQLWLGVRLAELGEDSAELGVQLMKGRHHLLPSCADTEPLLRGIVRQAAGAGPEREAVAAAYLATLVRVLRQRLALGRPTEAPAGPPYSYPVLRVMQLMQQRLGERLTMSDLAKASGLGVSQLSRRFRCEVGQSPARYHRQLRLDAARDRLLAPDATILGTAISCGFSSSQHMSRLFRDAVGMTPRTWQRHGTARPPR
jgi:AraC-like DNA-binding protein